MYSLLSEKWNNMKHPEFTARFVPFFDLWMLLPTPRQKSRENLYIHVYVAKKSTKQTIKTTQPTKTPTSFTREICSNFRFQRKGTVTCLELLGQKMMPFCSCCPRHSFTPRCQAMASAGRSCWTWTSRGSLRKGAVQRSCYNLSIWDMWGGLEGKLIVSWFFCFAMWFVDKNGWIWGGKHAERTWKCPKPWP